MMRLSQNIISTPKCYVTMTARMILSLYAGETGMNGVRGKYPEESLLHSLTTFAELAMLHEVAASRLGTCLILG